MLNNVLLLTDSYKVSHYRQYPKNTTKVYSYLEARSGGEYKEVMFFGLQYFLKKYFVGKVVTQEKIDQAEKFFKAHFTDQTLFNKAGWEHILKDHSGYLPILINAAPEGMMIPESNVMMTVENTCPHCSWLTNYIETILVEVWYPCTTGTISREMKKIIKKAMEISGTDTPENLMFRLHDFGFRGVSSPESAAIGGAAHLVNFYDTDTLAACELLMEYYNSEMPGFSIPAAEHSTITAWGKEGELAAYQNMLLQFPTGMVAVVSDSWDIRNAIKSLWGSKLRNQVLSRDGLLVIRPDSGDPVKLLPELLNIMGDRFGHITNNKGYKVLPDKVRLIQGDGIRRDTLSGILKAIMDAGWSADNISFGSGGGLLQDCNRDTQRMALKCSFIEVNGTGRNVYKQPATDPTKNSKSGRLMLALDKSGIITLPERTPGYTDLLRTVYSYGKLFIDYNLAEIRKHASRGII